MRAKPPLSIIINDSKTWCKRIERPDFTPDYITELEPDEVFVFGSNLAGMHVGGAAYVAFRQFGAVMGIGEGEDDMGV